MKWIAVRDELPDAPGMYICYFSDGCIEVFLLKEREFNLIKNGSLLWGVHNDYVTHWMPLPEAPE